MHVATPMGKFIAANTPATMPIVFAQVFRFQKPYAAKAEGAAKSKKKKAMKTNIATKKAGGGGFDPGSTDTVTPSTTPMMTIINS